MNLKNLTIGLKITLGFGAILFLLVILTTISVIGYNLLINNAKEVISGNKLDGVLAQKEVDHLNWVNKVNTLLTDESVHVLTVQTDDHKCGFGKWLYSSDRKEAETKVPELKTLIKQIEKPHYELHQSAIAIGNNYTIIDKKLGAFLLAKKVDHLLWTHAIKDAILNKKNELTIQLDPTKCGLGKWIYSPKTEILKKEDPSFAKLLEALIPNHNNLHRSAESIKNKLNMGQHKAAYNDFISQTAAHAESTLNVIDNTIAWHTDKMSGINKANTVYVQNVLPALQSIQTGLKAIRKIARDNIMNDEVMLNSAIRSKITIISLSVLIVSLGIILAFFIIKGITSVLKLTTASLNECSIQVAAAANQISSSSQNLAESASEQAATVEETSAAIVEIAATSKDTSEMTAGAEELMDKNIEKSGQSLRAIVEITTKMAQIESDSDQMGMIIKNIDQIAFQTNLLALNAAVEAARAGDAGAGFAVVADEVRNLAIRAAEAAKTTQELIDATIQRVNQISGAIRDMNDNFEGIVESATIIGEKTQGITKASSEVASGIEQINKATMEIEKVTQMITSSAEESAASSEELNAQAHEMEGMVKELTLLVHGSKNEPAESSDSKESHLILSDSAPHRSV